MKEIYLDYAASTYADDLIVKKMLPHLKQAGNPSSLHKLGRQSKSILTNARREAAEILGAKPEEIIFTGSGTEANNLAVLGSARANKQKGKHIVVSKIEHKSVLEAAKKLKKEGFEITYLNVDSKGLVKIKELKQKLRKETILVSIMYANNEIGTVQPIAEISKIIKKSKNAGSPVFHTDACQAAGALDLKVDKLGIDLLTLNGSKIYGPKGIGCLYAKKGIKLEPIIVGGEQEFGLRAGTENIASIVGFSEALKLAEKLKSKENKRLIELRDYFIKNILKSVPNCRLNGHPTKRLPNNVNVSIRGIEGESLVLMLDKYEIFASTGSACGASDLEPSHVILALNIDPEMSHSNIRFTLGRKTTEKEIDCVLKIIPREVKKLRTISSLK